ncbi:MAG: tRNA (N(6)-L-threonylcarbamoyladenosine(37)-C(2))-methylthiotransferase MtaB [Phycisphaerae bacterium]|nr:tRNA (N(6)-L-threonylcarbamoyladenosine(37)-C(2))-methylthiotransferase MtaB [Phycisphaerae bacterium]
MKTFTITTFGCKVNQYESEQIRTLLERLGLRKTQVLCQAELIIINSCCVTHTASAKCRRFIQRAQKTNPKSTIVVAGCLPVVDLGELSKPGKHIYLLKYRHELVDTLTQIVTGNRFTSPSLGSENLFCQSNIKPDNALEIKSNPFMKPTKLPILKEFSHHTRAFVKVQDGCDRFCTYCIIPKTRPNVHSREKKEIIKEVGQLVDAGHKEIVVTGVFLGAYGQITTHRNKWPKPENDQLCLLLENLAGIDGLERIRLSSLEPKDVSERLLDVMAGSYKIMPHLHLSLQSGSDNILRRMCRGYRRDEFYGKIEMIRSRLDRCAVTTDIIVGFPGESDEDFEQSVELAESVGFSKVHVFPFSGRAGTAAVKLQGVVGSEVIKDRAARLREVGQRLGMEFRKQFVGEKARVLVEQTGEKVSGMSERYFVVDIEDGGGRAEKNQIIEVEVVGNREDGVVGELLS